MKINLPSLTDAAVATKIRTRQEEALARARELAAGLQQAVEEGLVDSD